MTEVLVAGSTGGREHALGLAIYEDGMNHLTFTHGGNAGTRQIGNNVAAADVESVMPYAIDTESSKLYEIELAVVGPEAPLVAGLADKLRAAGIPTFGPGADGAQLEASKAFTARFCEEFGISQPDFEVVDDQEAAYRFMKDRVPQSYVIKADGLAGGKGVVLPENESEAVQTVAGMLDGSLFGDAGKQIVFQRRLDSAGPEVSALYVLDGKHFALLPLSQDHKRLLDGDEGPNTGGMGAYTPVNFADAPLLDGLMDIGERLTNGLQKRGIDYRGVAYVGAMQDASKDNRPSVLEINVRFGDPETQVILVSLGQLGISAFELIQSAAHGSLDPSLRGSYLGRGLSQAAITVCLASENYPNKPVTGKVIHGLDNFYEGVTVHHGGTKYDLASGEVLTTGGRVLYVTAFGETIDRAATRAYAAIDERAIHFKGMQYRADIGWQARSAA